MAAVRWRGARIAAGLVALLYGAACSPAPTPNTFIGQWVWSDQDVAVLARAKEQGTEVAAAVLIGTIELAGRSVVTRLDVSPRAVERTSPVSALVVRIEPNVARFVDSSTDSLAASTLTEHVLALLSLAANDTLPLQLDFDVPERLLPRWGRIVGAMRVDALARRQVWITTVPAYVRHRQFGSWFHGAVDGHVIQVFDNGDRYSPSRAEQVRRELDAAALPFQLGVGAFERRLPNGDRTDHRAWFEEVPRFTASRWYRGSWVFPAGRDWSFYRVGRR